MTDGHPPPDALAMRLRDGTPPNVALMLLLMETASPAAAAEAVALARVQDPALADAVAEVERLRLAHPGAWATVHAVSDSVDHAPPSLSPDATLDRWRDAFDRLAATAPEAGVALYALGDPALLAAATAEVVEALRGWGLAGPASDVLDLGCGIGRFAAALAPGVRSVLGLDLSPGMVEEARRRVRFANVRFAVGSGRDLAGVAAESLDLVLAADVFPYLVEAGLAERHVAEIARVLRPGGAAAILNYSYRGDPGRDRAELAAAAARHGLSLGRAGERPFRLWDGAVFTMTRDR